VFVSSSDEEAATESGHASAGHRAELKNVTALELSTLWSIVARAEWNAGLLAQFVCLLDEHDGELRVERFPETFVELLAPLSEAEIGQAAHAWAQTDELRGWSMQDTTAVVTACAALARRAVGEGKGLYLWNCV